jgi:hypothetical protein
MECGRSEPSGVGNSRVESLSDGRIRKFAVVRDDVPVPYSNVLRLLQADADFRTFFSSLLADSPFSAYRWETPPISTAYRDRAFEFVLLQSGSLDRPVDRTVFASHFSSGDDVVTVPNSGGDAIMVAVVTIDRLRTFSTRQIASTFICEDT